MKSCFKRLNPICAAGRLEAPPYHNLSLFELEQTLQTSLSQGLSSAQASKLLRSNGPNKITPHSESKLLKFISYFLTGFCPILWIASVICIISWKPLGEPDPQIFDLGLGIVIICVIVFQAVFTAYQDVTSSNVMKSILRMMPQSANVVRDGKDLQIPFEELVVGDMVNLSYGKKVPADLRITECHDLKFDKSMLTGENEPVEGMVSTTEINYNEAKNIAYMTSLVTNGTGKGMVIQKGDNTLIGGITRMTTSTKNHKTSLQKDISRFVYIIVFNSIVVASIVFIVWIAVLNVKYYGYLTVPQMLIEVISVPVAFVPEGLPVAVTLVLIIMAKKMAKSKILVKNLTTLETLSAVNIICSDKTGTITKNKMNVHSLLSGEDKFYADPSTESNEETKLLENKLKPEIPVIRTEMSLKENQKTIAMKQLITIGYLCNNAKYDQITKNTQGDATDIALKEFTMTQLVIEPRLYNTLSDIPFNSRNKWMMKLVTTSDDVSHKTFFGEEFPADHGLLLMKGAPEFLLKKCTYYITRTGKEEVITEKYLQTIKETQMEWSSSGQRVLVFIKKYIGKEMTKKITSLRTIDLEKCVSEIGDFCFVGMVGIIDPPKDGIFNVMKKCKQAGVKVFMVTGDFGLTAVAIARQVGIFSSKDPDQLGNVRTIIEQVPQKFRSFDLRSIKQSSFVIEGGIDMNKLEILPPKPEPKKRKVHELKEGEINSLLLNGADLDYLTPDDWLFVTKYDEVVFARTSPEQKLKVITEFQKAGNIIAVTGDGVNDAPSLKKANIGIAMGNGSDVAMEAGEVVLLDSNFSSILTAMENGRLIFQNLRKVIVYLIPAGTFAEILPVLINIFLGTPQTLSSFQMIIICMLTDLFPSLALMNEAPVIH